MDYYLLSLSEACLFYPLAEYMKFWVLKCFISGPKVTIEVNDNLCPTFGTRM